MKEMLGKIFGFIFKIFSIFTNIDSKKITFIMTHDDKFNGNIKYIYEEIKQKYPKFKFNIISRKDYDINRIKSFSDFINLIKQGFKVYIIKNYHLATSKYVFLNNIFITAAYLKFKKDVKVVQVWHAIGTFKKFGEEYKPSEKIDQLQKRANSIYTDVLVCSQKDIDVYSKAFNVPKEKVKAVGSPVCDLFDNQQRVQEIKNKIYNMYPQIQEKNVILYAPTFRDYDNDNMKILNYVEYIGENLKDNNILLLRLHPHIYKKYNYQFKSKNIIDVSKYEDVNELMIISDVLITDYSSLFYEYTYLEKPILFFAPDLEKYEKERGFYHEYKNYVPGEIIFSADDIIYKLNSSKYTNSSFEFKKNYFGCYKQKNLEKILDILK